MYTCVSVYVCTWVRKCIKVMRDGVSQREEKNKVRGSWVGRVC